ncbi:unnamed protein product [Cuscuta europaea]|uniref:Malectin-like domain-containing protein n=1 Tax=Cuscuta europaea TaxID=41803 RepID=A0A9P0YU46_CUSEU|nr:unnamed protein product [Cuscuta europaea]
MFLAADKTMKVCLGDNNYTESDPFISALEMLLVWDSLYNSTDFNKYALNLHARQTFGYNGSTIRYPDDEFDRYWEPFGEHSPSQNISSVSISGFWNRPPLRVFGRRYENRKPEPMQLLWPPILLLNATYHIALYFAND